MPHKGMQLAFYLEGAVCNDMTTSPYWQMQKMGYTYIQERIEKGTVPNHGDQLILI